MSVVAHSTRELREALGRRCSNGAPDWLGQGSWDERETHERLIALTRKRIERMTAFSEPAEGCWWVLSVRFNNGMVGARGWYPILDGQYRGDGGFARALAHARRLYAAGQRDKHHHGGFKLFVSHLLPGERKLVLYDHKRNEIRRANLDGLTS